jgi:hypothetical protein
MHVVVFEVFSGFFELFCEFCVELFCEFLGELFCEFFAVVAFDQAIAYDELCDFG